MQQHRYQPSKPALIEKLVAAGSYLTMGLIGFIWILLGIFTKSALRPYLKYHIFQSIFLSLGFFLLSQFLGLLLSILSVVPFVNQIIMQFTLYLNMPIFFSFSLIQVVINTVILYLVVTSLQGQYSYLPWVSNIIKANVKSS